MRNAVLLMASLLLGSMALAGGKRATAQGPSEQFATAEAMRVIPKGATITNTTCKSIDVGASSRYQCTITYSPELIDERLACCVFEPDPAGDPGCGARRI